MIISLTLNLFNSLFTRSFLDYKSAYEAFSRLDPDLDGPELLEFAMFLVKGALKKTQVC